MPPRGKVCVRAADENMLIQAEEDAGVIIVLCFSFIIVFLLKSDFILAKMLFCLSLLLVKF